MNWRSRWLPRRLAGLGGVAAAAWLALGLGCTAPAAPPSSVVVPVSPGPQARMILGVQTHFAFDRSVDAARVIGWIREARIDSTRDDMFWSDVEDAAGAYALRGGAGETQRAWSSQLPATQPLLVIGYGNPRYDGGGQPRSAQAVSAYAAQAGWLVEQTRSRVRRVEIWNEWNAQAGAAPGAGARGGAADYVRLAKAAGAAVKAADAGVEVIVGGIAEDFPNWRWMREALGLGLLDGADGVSVHLYNHCDRERVGADEMLSRLESLNGLVKARAATRELPIYLTETGWPTHRGDCGISEADAATYTARLLLETSLRRWIGGVWLYETIDGGNDPTNREHRFGLLRRDGSERPSGAFVRQYGALIAARPVQVARQGDVSVALYREGARATLFAWKREGSRPARLSVELSGASARAPLRIDLDGAAPTALELAGDAAIAAVRID